MPGRNGDSLPMNVELPGENSVRGATYTCAWWSDQAVAGCTRMARLWFWEWAEEARRGLVVGGIFRLILVQHNDLIGCSAR